MNKMAKRRAAWTVVVCAVAAVTLASSGAQTSGGAGGTAKQAGGMAREMAPCVANNVLYVGQEGCFAGSDIGEQIDAAYATLPAAGGRIEVVPKADGSCYDFRKPIVLATRGKYVLLEGAGASGAGDAQAIGGCLNYEPTTATAAITLDYVPKEQSPLSAAHGIRNLTIINNSCFRTGGCRSKATGIAIGNENAGAYGATFDNVGIDGFGMGFSDTNNRSVQMNWFNAQIFYNDAGFRNDRTTGMIFFGGQMAANGRVFAAAGAHSASEYTLYGTEFFANAGLVFDATASGEAGSLDCFGCHFENAGSAAAARFIDGPLNITLNGGVMESDIPDGTHDWMIRAQGGELAIDGMRFYSGEHETIGAIVYAERPVRGWMRGFVASAGHFESYAAGPGSNGIRSEIATAGGETAAAVRFESPVMLQGALTLGSTTVAGLPPAASAPGAMMRVSDSTPVTSEGQTCSGGGTSVALAFSNGKTWKCF